MPEQTYFVTGMTCDGCVKQVREHIVQQVSGINSVRVQLDSPQVRIDSEHHIEPEELQKTVSAAGNYKIFLTEQMVSVKIANYLKIYWPLFLVITYIGTISFLVQYPFTSFSAIAWMRHFMAGFFLVFSFFKFLNIKEFATTYKMYDIVAAKWATWGHIYPFVELSLGILYLIDLAPVLTNLSTAFVLGISSIGVIQSNRRKQEIKCACLGSIFQLPMSKITIIEDVTMVGMAVAMLIFLSGS